MPGDAPLRRRILRQDLRPDEARDAAFRRVILSIPRGKVMTYGAVAASAGYPLRHRAVARMLRQSHGNLPWQRVVGSGGQIKTKLDLAAEQVLRLRLEGVTFRGPRVDLALHVHQPRTWEL